ncbi:MAG TPA: polyphosphate kinase 1 [Acidobacteriaceae bacterium]|jgi:polyphosphate kinase|nr:polyphosphate kinase 1 [Acidobacteriaceae bacterium]
MAATEVRYFNREESWLDFNSRVLEEAQDPTNPLLERVKFLAITASNLDEFFEIRVAGILQRIEDGYTERGPDGLMPQQVLDRIAEKTHAFVDEQYACWKNELLPALAKASIRVIPWQKLDAAARKHAIHFYQSEVDPLLTPVTIDPSHPFPRVLNKALCLALLLRRKRKTAAAGPILGVVTVPRALPRLVPIPSAAGTYDYIFLHDLIESQAAALFRGYTVLSTAAFRVTRNSNLYLQGEESRSLLESVRTELHNRRKGDAVRMEIEKDADIEIVERLRTNFELDEFQVFRTDGPVNLSRLMNLYSKTPVPELKYPSFSPRELRLNRQSSNLFEELHKRDILLHHPYDSYDAVVGLIQAAAEDPNVLSIKQTLYRTTANSAIFQALREAAQSKEVTVVVELMARFDEASNIRWSRDLEDAGVQVFHGLVGIKTHSKMALLVRRDPDGTVRRYAHLATGNYNAEMARFYTDISLLTANPIITSAVHSVFNYLTANSESDDYQPLLVAPLSLAESFIRLIHREAEHAREGRSARIIAKMNSLLEPGVIEALYLASQAGVSIDLIVRGICALRPGVKGLSENIRVRSIVGQFLEHSRIFYFQNDGKEEVFCGSADWMQRNLFERCEVVFPVLDPLLRQRLRDDILSAYLADTRKTRWLLPSGEYIRAANPLDTSSVAFSAQEYFMRQAEGKSLLESPPPAALPPRATQKASLPAQKKGKNKSRKDSYRQPVPDKKDTTKKPSSTAELPIASDVPLPAKEVAPAH